jgi:signal transduction histidine kinase/CheY-like chemotaxis protein
MSEGVDKEAVVIELTRILFGNALRSNIAVIIAASLIVLIFWPKIPHSFLYTWAACFAVIVLYRFSLIARFRAHQTQPADIHRYRNCYLFGTFLLSLCWMVIITAGLGLPEFEYRVYAILLFVSLLGASIPSLAASQQAIAIYVLTPGLVAVPFLFVLGGKDLLTGFALAFYMFMMLKSGKNLHETLVDTISLRVGLEKLRNNLEVKVAERTAELEISRDMEQKANKAKSAFIANISHEIRTPMNAIINLSSTVLQQDLPDRAGELIRIIHQSGTQLLGLINDILDFSRIESGRLKIETVPFDIMEVLSELHAELDALARGKGISFSLIVPEYRWGKYRGDPLRVRQILGNIIGNAIKFTDRGSVIVKVQEIPQDTGSVIVECTVTDTGIGIPEDQLDQIFNRFHQVDASSTRKYGGSGLGLAISRQLAELMGGSIAVTSTSGRGSSFCIRLPFAAAEPEPQPEQQLGDESDTDGRVEQLRHRRGAEILVVDDIPANQVVLGCILENLDMRMTSAGSGAEALELLQRHRFDMVLMDIQMPGMDGYEVTRRIREEPRWAQLPVIAITANALPEDLQQCFEAGMGDCLVKPFDLGEIHRVLLKWLPEKGHGGISATLRPDPASEGTQTQAAG